MGLRASKTVKKQHINNIQQAPVICHTFKLTRYFRCHFQLLDDVAIESAVF